MQACDSRVGSGSLLWDTGSSQIIVICVKFLPNTKKKKKKWVPSHSLVAKQCWCTIFQSLHTNAQTGSRCECRSKPGPENWALWKRIDNTEHELIQTLKFSYKQKILTPWSTPVWRSVIIIVKGWTESAVWHLVGSGKVFLEFPRNCTPVLFLVL